MKNFKKNNQTIALNVFYIKNKKMYPPSVSKHNSEHENQIKLSMVLDHDLALAKLSTLLREITSKDHKDFYCLNFIHSFRAEKV